MNFQAFDYSSQKIEEGPVKIRSCEICGMNDPESKKVQCCLSHPDGYVPICRSCWQETEEEENQREQERREGG